MNSVKEGSGFKIKTVLNPVCEKQIASYETYDVITKKGGMLEGVPASIEEYRKGYYVINLNLMSKLSKKYPALKIDSLAVVNLLMRLDSLSFEPDKPDDIVPFCGGRYKRLPMKVEALLLDDVEQRLPLFVDCANYENYIKSHGGKNYQLGKVPTYLITSVR
jgi:hypothetical protein